MKNQKSTRTARTTTYSNIFVGLASLASSLSILGGVGANIAGQEMNNFYAAAKADVKVVDGTYDVPQNGSVVHYRACYPREMIEGATYPAVLFAPGLTIRQDYWTPWCIFSAQNDYIVLIKDRPGARPIDNLYEVEAGIDFLRSIAYIDNDRVMMGANSYGNRETQNYVLTHQGDIPGYFNISGYNDPEKYITPGSYQNHKSSVLVLSGGGETIDTKDCDSEGYEWTSNFTEKLLQENPEMLWNRVAFDADTYGCTPHGYMWDPELPATQESARLIAEFMNAMVGRGPTK